ncbi:MAG: hypothetical protein GY870_16605 [archaeon]|nr:hypothetical protein [archaeon]
MELKSRIEKLKERSIEIFKNNRHEEGDLLFHQASPGIYSSFFAWDSGWNIIAMSNLDPELALRELQSLFSLQTDEGRISHETLMKSEKNLARKFINFVCKGEFDEKRRSYFIDPPSYLLAAEKLYDRTKDKRIFDLLPSMEKCFNYYVEKRDFFGDGLASIVHPWESGCDWAPYFDEPTGIDINKRFWILNAIIKYISMVRRSSKMNWDYELMKKKSWFMMEDVGINGIAAAGAVSISKLYKAAKNEQKSQEFLSKAQNLINAIEKHLWVESKGYFYPRENPKNPKNLLRSTSIGLSPLLTGLVDPVKANSILENYLLSEDHFKGPYVVPFNSRSELEKSISFTIPILWRGPCIWTNINWIAAKAAAMYGRRDISKEITMKTMELIEKSDFREYYHPEEGIGGGAKNFTWAALVIDMIIDYLIT